MDFICYIPPENKTYITFLYKSRLDGHIIAQPSEQKYIFSQKSEMNREFRIESLVELWI